MSHILQWLDDLLNRAARPFLKARTLEQYSTRGYWIFGLLVILLIIGFLQATGYIASIFSNAPAQLLNYLKPFLDKIGLGALPSPLPMIVLLSLVYLALGLSKHTRLPLGEFFANTFFRILDLSIAAGEWCIARRGWSTIIIMLLASVLAVGLYREINRSKRHSLYRQDFEQWITLVERFVTVKPLIEKNEALLSELDSAWRKEFTDILSVPGGYTHPALSLNKMFELLRTHPEGVGLNPFLRSKESELEAIVRECDRNCRPYAQMEEGERRTRDLMSMQMGKSYNRMGEDLDEPEAMLLRGFEHFNAVDLTKYTRDDERDKAYLSAVHNGKGTLYASAFSALVKAPRPRLRATCAKAADCAREAIKSYEEASKGYKDCSPQYNRKLNNMADMLSRIGVNFRAVYDKDVWLQQNEWMKGEEHLAKRLEAEIMTLMSCNRAKTFESAYLLTVAQAYATCATLRSQAGQPWERETKAAGTYLRLANSFEPDNIQVWEFPYFCVMIKDGQLNPTFKEAIEKSLDGMPEVKLGILLNMMREKCGPR